MILPPKKSRKWFFVLLILFAVNLAMLLLSRNLLDVGVSQQNLIAFIVLSLVVSVIAFLGYWGIRLFSQVFIIFDLVGLAYLFYATFANKSSGWADLTGIIALFLTLAAGVVVAIIAELIYRLTKRKRMQA